MSDLKFTWDIEKDLENQKKHGVSFEEAQSVFSDASARFMPDLDHSEEEERFILLGVSEKTKLLVVCHCYREKEDVIRIISARKAMKKEKKQYRGFL